jgi:predicted acylesterase/phospholipase RssA
MGFDLVLSSGFLAFARHVGVLRAIERRGCEVSGVCGTSSGALIGALWAAGASAETAIERVTVQQPFALMRWNWRVWQGLYSLDDVVAQLAEWLPARIEDLPIPFGVGVMDQSGQSRVLTSGPLPEAVAASCAIPWLFAPVCVDGEVFRDGGVVDRTGLAAWRTIRGSRATVLHLVDRTGGAETDIGAIDPDVHIIHTARSGARFWNLGDVARQVQEAEDKADIVLSLVR